MNNNEIKSLIEKIGFIVDSLNADLYSKRYKKHGNYKLNLNFVTNKIDYGSKITLGDKTTSNFYMMKILLCLNVLIGFLKKVMSHNI